MPAVAQSLPAPLVTLLGQDALERLQAAEAALLDALARVDRVGREAREELIREAVGHEKDALQFPAAAAEAMTLASNYKADARAIDLYRRGILRLRLPIAEGLR